MPDYNTPLIPAAPVKRLQDAIDTPTLERSPWEARVRGFGAGALDGLRNLSSPANLVSIGSLLVPGMGEGVGLAKGAKAVSGAAQGLSDGLPSIQAVSEGVNGLRQAMPTAREVTGLLGQMGSNLKNVPTSAMKALKMGTPSSADPHFVPMGGEGAYNASRAGLMPKNPQEMAYEQILSRGGR